MFVDISNRNALEKKENENENENENPVCQLPCNKVDLSQWLKPLPPPHNTLRQKTNLFIRNNLFFSSPPHMIKFLIREQIRCVPAGLVIFFSTLPHTISSVKKKDAKSFCGATNV